MPLINLIRLWLLGLQVPLTVLDNERVKWELAQSPVDGLGLLEAIQQADTNYTTALFEAKYQLELITLVNSNGQEMVTLG